MPGSEYTNKLNVFICHSSNDEILALDLYNRLIADNNDVWIDVKKLLPGQDWDFEIREAVRKANIVIVCLSRGSVNKAGYIQKEIKYALDVADEQPEGKVFLIPLKFEECDVPSRLRRWQWVDIFKENGYQKLKTALESKASIRISPHFYKTKPLSELLEDLRPILKSYLNSLINRYQYLDFKGMGINSLMPIQFKLLDLYVPLNVWIKAPIWETWDRDLPPIAGQQYPLGGFDTPTKSIPILDLLTNNTGLVILGDPGSGKTTFLKYMALELAQKGTLFLSEKELLPKEIRLPILIPISAYANAISQKQGGCLRLDEFIIKHLYDRGGDHSFEPLLKHALKHGMALIMLDGLDEISDYKLRNTVVRNFEDFFSNDIQNGNKYLLTSRIIGYREVRPSVSGLAECTITDFDDEEIIVFVRKWTSEIAKKVSATPMISEKEAEREEADLLSAINNTNTPGVRKLASNPLMLTILSLMKRQGLTLPQRRADLYWNFIETFLLNWNRVRSLGSQNTNRDIDILETMKVLAPLAMWVYEKSGGRGLINRFELENELTRIYTDKGEANPEAAASHFLKDIHEHAGLIVERGKDQYGFIHLTFQEYLAAIALAQHGQESVAPIINILLDHISDSSWREISLLTIGYLGIVQHRELAASSVVEGLLNDTSNKERGLRVLLAGDAVVDASSVGVTNSCRLKTINAIIQVMDNCEEIKISTREKAGRVLAKLSDPRQSVMTVDKMQFFFIPPGEFLMGDSTMEETQNKIKFGYWISRYPITNAQYSCFIQDGGYGNSELWTEAKIEGYWREGKFNSRWGTLQPRDRPFDFGEPICYDNHPVVGITWYEAIAFCRWFNLKYRSKWPDGYFLIIPSVMEWVKAGRGGIQIPNNPISQVLEGGLQVPNEFEGIPNPFPNRQFPWGEESDENKANTLESELGTTSAVGCFQNGSSPYGCEELCGNTWEWTRNSQLGNVKVGESLTIDPASNVLLRGYSWHYPEKGTLFSHNYFNNPGYWSDDIGLRVVVTKFPYS